MANNVAFIDFTEAFGLVDRSCLWAVLRKNSLVGKLYRATRSMYDVVRTRVRVGFWSNRDFYVSSRFEAGRNMQPTFFLYLSLYQWTWQCNELKQNDKHGRPITFSPELFQLLIMLLADDVVLLSYTVIGPKQQLNFLRDTAKRLGLDVNLHKSNVIVFRNGGHIAVRDKWLYGGIKLETVVGVIFSTELTCSYSLEDMATRASKGLLGILKLLSTLGEQSPKSFFNLLTVRFSLCLLMDLRFGVWWSTWVLLKEVICLL